MPRALAPLLFVVLWSSAFVAVRAGLPDISPLFFLAARFALAAAALLCIVTVIRRSWVTLSGHWHHLVISGVLMNAAYLSAAYSAMVHIDAATMTSAGTTRRRPSPGASACARKDCARLSESGMRNSAMVVRG